MNKGLSMKLPSQIEKDEIIFEMRVQEAIGTMHRYKVEVYHDEYSGANTAEDNSNVSKIIAKFSNLTKGPIWKQSKGSLKINYTIDRTIYATVFVWAESPERACAYVWGKYRVDKMTDTGVNSEQYHGDPIPHYVVSRERSLTIDAPPLGSKKLTITPSGEDI